MILFYLCILSVIRGKYFVFMTSWTKYPPCLFIAVSNLIGWADISHQFIKGRKVQVRTRSRRTEWRTFCPIQPNDLAWLSQHALKDGFSPDDEKSWPSRGEVSSLGEQTIGLWFELKDVTNCCMEKKQEQCPQHDAKCSPQQDLICY